MAYALEMRGITKQFPGVKALDEVTFQVKKGEIHALCGENGAGKSTLMKVLSGLYPDDSFEGDLYIDGEKKTFQTINDAEKAGIAIIYQELALVRELTVAENLFLGNEPSFFGVLQWDKMFKETEHWLQEVGLRNVSPDRVTGTLGIGQQQLVEIAKALSKNMSILILDEPTAALTEQEVEILLDILRELRKNGVTCIYISHKLNEVFSIADSITVLRDGRSVASRPAAELTENDVIALMVGRELKERYPPLTAVPQQTIMTVKDYCVKNPEQPDKYVVDHVSFELRRGEILGIAGLMGAGRTELVMSLFGGYGSETSGQVEIDGEVVHIRNPWEAIEAGMALVSEDRKKYGLVLDMPVQSNLSLSYLSRLSRVGVINNSLEVVEARKQHSAMQVKSPSLESIVGTLSGGNQQKVVLGKWLMTEPKILIMDEPTRGIDIGAKYEIYSIMNELASRGVGIIMISSELPEVLGMSHRILVLSEGKLAGEFSREEATQEKIMTAATGGNKK